MQALLVSPDNLDRIMSTLEANFGRSEQIVWHLIDKAKRVPAPREEEFESFLNFSNTVVNMSSTMKTLGCDAHLQNPQLLRELVDKLPGTLKFDWTKSRALNKNVSLEDFSEWLEMMTRILGSTATFTESKSRKKENAFHLKEKKENSCQMCDIDGHIITKCRKFSKLTYDKKQKLVIEQGLCFRCLESGHRSRDCPVKKKCGVHDCDKFHHPLLHKDWHLYALDIHFSRKE